MDKQKVLAKVEKLMALANAKGATPNEAETALRQAAILKRQFDLSEAEISAHTVETACVPTRTRRSPAPWLHELAGICASSFGCDYLAAYAMPAGWTFKFMGRGIGPELAAHAYSTLHHQLVAARSAHVAQQKRCKLSTKRRRSKLFVEGWLLAVRSLVRDFAGRPDESTQAAIKAYLELHHPELKLLEPAAPTKPLAYDQASLHAGWEHGKNTRLHRGVSRRVQGALEQEVPDDSLCSLDHRLRGPGACPPQIQQPRGALHPRNLDCRTGTGAVAPVSGYAERGPSSQVEQNGPADLRKSPPFRTEKSPELAKQILQAWKLQIEGNATQFKKGIRHGTAA
ncbi:DUF2786 domain-containing protein [Pseudomonas aeruginosa]|nr:DUF2786 domain-containing protein [Pseudomonas aeruginosa]